MSAMIESLGSVCVKVKCLRKCLFSSSDCGRLKLPCYVPVGLACLAPYILLHVNETGAYLRRAPAFLVPEDISACTDAPGAAD